jgi:CHAD domain-containing protein
MTLQATSNGTGFGSPSSELQEQRARLEQLLHDRLKRFMSNLPAVLAEDAPEAVHDIRVWSRRLQQVVAVLSPDPPSDDARTMMRVLRRTRRSLGGWRDCDVLIDLLEDRADRVRNPEENRACDIIRDFALRKRARHMRRARRRLANRKLFTLEHRAQKFLQDLSHGEHQDARDVLASSIAEGYAQWRRALSCACDSFDSTGVHSFRLRTKRLRYLIELMRDFDATSDTEAVLSLLKSLQDGLGRWHDHAEFARLTAEALADPKFLLEQARLAAGLLLKADHERVIHEERVRRLLADTQEAVGGSALDEWVARNCRETPAHGREEEFSADAAGPATSNGANGAALHAAQVRSLPAACPTEVFVKVVSGLPR